jgi:hypothetical protein
MKKGPQFYGLVRIESRIRLGLVRELRRRGTVFGSHLFLQAESMF